MTKPEGFTGGPLGQSLLWGLILLCCGLELALLISDWAGSVRLRRVAYEYAGFWPGLLVGWQPNYPAQPYLMFFSYGFLHGGPGHLVVNMITLWSLGTEVLSRTGARGLALLYVTTLLGGAVGYAFLAQTPQPMVGASGALFGLAGGILAWRFRDGAGRSDLRWQVLRVVLFLVAMNVAMYWALDGQLAWQTHLGGFLAGWLIGRRM